MRLTDKEREEAYRILHNFPNGIEPSYMDLYFGKLLKHIEMLEEELERAWSDAEDRVE